MSICLSRDIFLACSRRWHRGEPNWALERMLNKTELGTNQFSESWTNIPIPQLSPDNWRVQILCTAVCTTAYIVTPILIDDTDDTGHGHDHDHDYTNIRPRKRRLRRRPSTSISDYLDKEREYASTMCRSIRSPKKDIQIMEDILEEWIAFEGNVTSEWEGR